MLALILSLALSSGRTALRLAGNMRQAAALQSVADGAVQLAVFHLAAAGAQRWHPDGAVHRLVLAGCPVDIVIGNEADKINPNTASVDLLAALFGAVGVSKKAAFALATAMDRWRSDPPSGQSRRPAGTGFMSTGTPFEDLAELRLMPGMTPRLFALIAPHLTLIHEGDPDAATRDPLVRKVLVAVSGRRVMAAADPRDRDETAVLIDVTALGAGTGARAQRVAGVRLGGNARGGPAQILSWGAL